MKNKSAFTLIELLLGLTIFALISATAYSVFSGGIKLSNRADKHNLVYREANMAFDLMALDIKNAVNYNFTNSDPEKSPFVGEEHFISFLHATEDGLKVISYHLITPQFDSIYRTIIEGAYRRNIDIVTGSISTDRVNYLIREEQMLIDYLNEGIDDKKDIEVIATKVRARGLRFRFGYMIDEEAQAVEYREQWDNPFVPSSIKIEMDFVNEREKNLSFTLARDIYIPTGLWGKEK